MKIIISFNGVDGSGKTTQVKLLKDKNPDLIETFGGLEKYYPFCEKNSFDWWFNKSTPEEFAGIMYDAIKQRNEEISKSKKPIVIIDKGIKNFDARILATLQFKGLNQEEARKLINTIKRRLNIKEVEDVDIFLNIAQEVSDRLKLTAERKYKGMDFAKRKIYSRYQLFQNMIIKEQQSEGQYLEIDVTGSIEEVYKKIMKVIYRELNIRVLDIPENKTIYALGGLSECGKSGVGQYMNRKHNVWNMKLKYILELLCQKYDIDNSDNIFRNDVLLVGLLEKEEIARFMKTHYYVDKISLESLHNYDFTQILKEIFQTQLKIIYIDTDYKKRIIRNAIAEDLSVEESKKRVDIKDKVKKSVGADKIKDIADFVINNNETYNHLMQQIDQIVQEKQTYHGSIILPEQMDIPIEYKKSLCTFVDNVKQELGSQLKMLLVTGSCARECVHTGYSDIDIIMVVEKNNANVRKIINSNVKDSKIKIGTTVYSQYEFSELKVDEKTIYAIYEVMVENYKPTIIDKNLEIPYISLEDVKQYLRNSLPSQLHSLRRKLYDYDNVNYDSVFKELSHIIRVVLIQEGIDATSYEDVYKKFARKFRKLYI